MELKALREIGLTEGETRVYLTLTKLGQTKTGLLAKEACVSSSKVYKILDRLEKKGLVGHIIKSKIKYFSATDPGRILDYMEEKETELKKKKELVKQIIPQLEMERKLSQQETEMTMYEGLTGIKHLFLNMIDELKPGEEYFVLNADYGSNPAGLKPWFQKYHKIRTKKRIKVNMLASHKTKGNLVSATNINSAIRYLPENLFSKMDVTFYKDKAFIFFVTEDPKAILIKNQEIVNGFKTYFNTFWNMAKP